MQPRLLIVESTADPASRTIAASLRGRGGWKPVGPKADGEAVQEWEEDPAVMFWSTPTLHLNLEPALERLLAAGVEPESIVVLSKHKAASGRPALTVHPVGNFTEALYGGLPGRLGPTVPGLQSELLRALHRGVQRAGYAAEVTFEVTHHGPLVDVPLCFLELGSGPAQWEDPAGARIVADALLGVLSRPVPEYPVAVGIGGGHYGPRFTEAALSQRVHFGHLVPTHAAQAVQDAGAMMEELRRATRGLAGVYFHRKALERDTLERWRQAAEAAGIPILDSNAWPPLEATV